MMASVKFWKFFHHTILMEQTMQQIYQISRLELEVLMLNQLFFKKELLKYMMLFLIPVMFKKYFFLKV